MDPDVEGEGSATMRNIMVFMQVFYILLEMTGGTERDDDLVVVIEKTRDAADLETEGEVEVRSEVVDGGNLPSDEDNHPHVRETDHLSSLLKRETRELYSVCSWQPESVLEI
mgnify:FL=1